MIGTTLGQYRIVERLGQGGMGAVYRAVDDMLQREVAIKLLRPDLVHRPEVVDRFRTEAITLARLDHPNIARLYGLSRQDAHLYMVMEYVPGLTLQARLEQTHKLPARDAVPLLVQLLDALHYAHGLGVVHRDIKPGNVIVRPDGRVKVTDFGIARVLGTERATRTGYMVGTLHYMAPEQIRGEEVDARTDLYAVGVLFYELLTGRVPFTGASEYDVITGHLQKPVPSVRQSAPDAPPWVDLLLAQAMAKQAARRFDSAERFRIALAEAAATPEEPEPDDAPTVLSNPGMPIPATRLAPPVAPPPPPTRVAAPAVDALPGRAPAAAPADLLARVSSRPRPQQAALAALLLLLVAVPLALALWPDRPLPQDLATPSSASSPGPASPIVSASPAGSLETPPPPPAPLEVRPLAPPVVPPPPRSERPPSVPRPPERPEPVDAPPAPAPGGDTPAPPPAPSGIDESGEDARPRTFPARRFELVMLVDEEGEMEEHDVVLTLEGNRLVVKDEDEEQVLRMLAYDGVRDLLYAHTRKPSWRSGPNRAVGVLSAPVNIFRGARHWLTIQDGGSTPIVLKLDGDQVPDLISELEQRTGRRADRRSER